jgi:hypothetical protein
MLYEGFLLRFPRKGEFWVGGGVGGVDRGFRTFVEGAGTLCGSCGIRIA